MSLSGAVKRRGKTPRLEARMEVIRFLNSSTGEEKNRTRSGLDMTGEQRSLGKNMGQGETGGGQREKRLSFGFEFPSPPRH